MEKKNNHDFRLLLERKSFRSSHTHSPLCFIISIHLSSTSTAGIWRWIFCLYCILKVRRGETRLPYCTLHWIHYYYCLLIVIMFPTTCGRDGPGKKHHVISFLIINWSRVEIFVDASTTQAGAVMGGHFCKHNSGWWGAWTATFLVVGVSSVGFSFVEQADWLQACIVFGWNSQANCIWCLLVQLFSIPILFVSIIHT